MKINFEKLPEYKGRKLKTTTEKRRFDFAEMRIKNKLAAIDSILRTCNLKEVNKEKLKELVKNKY